MAGADDSTSPRTLLIGPGPRLAVLRPLIAALQDEFGEDDALQVRSLPDLEPLLGNLSGAGIALLDADRFPIEDLGLVRRFLERRPHWSLVLTGVDSGSRVARFLLGRPDVRWTPWPLDVEQLRALLVARAPRPAALLSASGPAEPRADDPAGDPTAAAPHASAHRRPAGETADLAERLQRELAAIESILDGEEEDLLAGLDPLGEGSGPPSLALSREELEAFLDPSFAPAPPEGLPPEASAEPEAAADGAATPAPGTSTVPPRWYRAQVADLADATQRLDLSLLALREALELAKDAGDAAGGSAAALERLAADHIRLVQLVRTLGFLAAPPRRGVQEIALGTLVEELLGGLAGARPSSPRYLFRAQGDVAVHSDKTLLVQAFDALLAVGTACSTERDVVRVSVERSPAGDVLARITFPAGPLASVAPERALEPYGVRRELPQVGPNALAAASRLISGQGGRLALGGDGSADERLAFEVRLPAARP